MRSILTVLLLLIAMMALYEETIGGDDGAQNRVKERGGRIHEDIGRIDP